MKDLQKICFQFVWNGKQDRIARKTTIKDVKSGGLNIPDMKTYILALKLIWIKKRKKLKMSNHTWRNVPLELHPFLHQLEAPALSTKLSKIIPSGQTSSKLVEFSLVK